MHKKLLFSSAALAVLLIAAVGGRYALRPRDHDGISTGPSPPLDSKSANLIARDADRLGSASVVVAQNGRIIFGWGDVDKPTDIRSMRKSVLNLVIGRLVAAHKLNLDATLAQLGIDDRNFALNAIERTATVRQLMEARSGIYHLAARETRSAAKYRPDRGDHAPGTFWYYNNWDFNALETIAAQAAGDADYCRTFVRYAASALQIADPQSRCERQEESNSIHAAHVIRMTARELARLCQVFLDEDRKPTVLPRGWTQWSTRRVSHFDFISDSKFYYGRLFWVVAPYAGAHGDSFMMRGVGSQYAWVIPEDRLIIVHLVRTKPLLLRNRLGLIPDDNDAWTFGGRIASFVLRREYQAPRLY